MRRSLAMRSIASASFIALLCSTISAETTKASQTSETLTIKNKLANAEGKVSDLISRLDAVSGDATRAKNEIHSTLMEVWKIVDLLGRDRCGDVVDKVRVAQKKAETKVAELQEEIRVHLKDIESLKLQLAKSGDSSAALQTEIKAERSRRETLEAEARELRDKLHWASAVTNETQKYEVVAERLQNLLVVVTERTKLLTRVMTLVGDAQSGFSEWKSEIESLTTLVRNAERDFSGDYKNTAVEGLRRQTTDLERRLKEALNGRESMADERNMLRRSIQTLQEKLSSAGSIVSGSSKGQKERIIVRSDHGTSMLGVLTLCMISLCTGAVGVFLLSSQTRDIPPTPQQPVDKYGFTPTSSRTSPGFQQSAPSPMQYANPGSASRTPGSRGSTPRRY